MERIVALHPDVVLTLPAFNGSDTIAALERLKIPVILFRTTNLNDIYRNIATVGRVLGREREAASLVPASARARARFANRPKGRVSPACS